MGASVISVPAMHEEMNQRARKEHEVWQHAQEMSAMLCPKKERRNDE
jgi:hypothetical protein